MLEPPPLNAPLDDKASFKFFGRWYDYWNTLKRYIDTNKITVKTDTFSTNSTSWTDITGLSVALTPTKNSSKLKIQANLSVGLAAAHQVGFRVTRNGTAIGVGDAASSRIQVNKAVSMPGAGDMVTVVLEMSDFPQSNAVLTYQVQCINLVAGTVLINRTSTDTNSSAFPRAVSSISTEEIF